MNPFAPPSKGKLLERLAEENGVAVVVLDGEGNEAATANNNSICAALYGSSSAGSECAKFCGRAFEMTAEGAPEDYVCHAGLSCQAIPVVDGGRSFVAIVGRVFLRAENYRETTKRAIDGEWQGIRPSEFFENILIGATCDGIHQAAAGLKKFVGRESNDILELPASEPPTFARPVAETALPTAALLPEPSAEAQETALWRSLFGSLMQLNYQQACKAILEFLSERYGLASLAWFERRDNRFENVVATGAMAHRKLRLAVKADDEKLAKAAQASRPLWLRLSQTAEHPADDLLFFPVAIGGLALGAIVSNLPIADTATVRRVVRFAQTVASPLEILRLRSEVRQRESLSMAVKRFNESLRNIDGDDFWLKMAQISAELLHAERASILVRDEKSLDLRAKAAIGSRIDLLSEKSVGSRVARHVLDAGNPVIVSNIDKTGMKRAPREWFYKSASFISYPIIIGERKVGILNFTDKAGGDQFDRGDLELLQAIAPQIAVAIDRTALKDKAGEYEQLSVTDTLTGLLNRRYIEERLGEEIVRSKRHRFPMSLMMLDVDHFKAYNDSFGHPAGDRALKIVANALKDTLRGADVAARYGGEEFAVLLPQTSAEEASRIAERIRQRIERTAFPMRQVTVSIGIASCTAEISTPQDLISAADIALYEAKDHGRNNVRSFGDLGDSLAQKIH